MCMHLYRIPLQGQTVYCRPLPHYGYTLSQTSFTVSIDLGIWLILPVVICFFQGFKPCTSQSTRLTFHTEDLRMAH
jgi:hypothetical protein